MLNLWGFHHSWVYLFRISEKREFIAYISSGEWDGAFTAGCGVVLPCAVIQPHQPHSANVAYSGTPILP